MAKRDGPSRRFAEDDGAIAQVGVGSGVDEGRSLGHPGAADLPMLIEDIGGKVERGECWLCLVMVAVVVVDGVDG